MCFCVSDFVSNFLRSKSKSPFWPLKPTISTLLVWSQIAKKWNEIFVFTMLHCFYFIVNILGKIDLSFLKFKLTANKNASVFLWQTKHSYWFCCKIYTFVVPRMICSKKTYSLSTKAAIKKKMLWFACKDFVIGIFARSILCQSGENTPF